MYSSPEKSSDGLSYAIFIKSSSEEGKPDELVISFRGTDEWLGIPADPDDFDAAIGSWSNQVYLAFKATLGIIAANPGKNVSFTGHSLGGGLASLMAVWFGREATIFDSAPFEKSAFNLPAYIDRYLNDNFSAKARVFERGSGQSDHPPDTVGLRRKRRRLDGGCSHGWGLYGMA